MISPSVRAPLPPLLGLSLSTRLNEKGMLKTTIVETEQFQVATEVKNECVQDATKAKT